MKSETLYWECVKNNRNAWTYAYNYAIAVLKKKQTDPDDIEDIAQMVMLYYIQGGLSRSNEPGRFKYLLARKTGMTRISYYLQYYRTREQSWEIVINRENGPEQVTMQNFDKCENTLEHDLSIHTIAILAKDLLNELDDQCSRILKTYYRGKAVGTRVKELAVLFGIRSNTFSQRVVRCQEKLHANPRFKELLNMCKTHMPLES